MMYPKPISIISKSIRRSANGESCTLRIPGPCNGNRETVVWAHIRTASKGTGNKSPDIFGVYACSGCHTALDANKVNHKDQLRAMTESQLKLIRKGLLEVK